MLKGSIVALITPMSDNGAIDFAALSNLIEYHVNNGTTGIVALGTTGEAVTLSFDEQLQVVAHIADVLHSRIPLFVGNGGNSTFEVVERCKPFENLKFDGYLSVVPYYNKPSQQGLVAHFTTIALSTKKPILLYNVPSRTVTDLMPETVAQLAKIDNIIGIKEATGELERVAEIKSLCGNDFICLSGDDVSALEFIHQGGDGVISVTANVAAKMMAQMCQSVLQGDYDAAKAMNQKLSLLHQRLFIESNPVAAKWILNQNGLIASDQVRLPLLRLEPIYQNAVKQALQFAGLI